MDFKKENQSHPKVSIVIVTYNAALYLQGCIDSIIGQRFTDREIVIIDGASKDETPIIQKNSDHIGYWSSEPDKGIYDAMNKAIENCEGKWIFFLGADDRLLPGFSELAEALSEMKTVYYGYCIMDGNVLGKAFSKYQLAKMNVCHQCIFYPSGVFKKYRYDIRYKIYADYLLNIQCWGDDEFPKKYLPIGVSNYQSGGFSFTGKDDLFILHKPDFVKKYLGILVYFRYLLKKRKEKRKKKQLFLNSRINECPSRKNNGTV